MRKAVIVTVCLLMALCMAASFVPALAAETHNLPAEYQELEYIESDGNQFINSEIPVNSKLVIDCTFQVTIPGLTGKGGGAGIVGGYYSGGTPEGTIQFAYKRSDAAFTTRIGNLMENKPEVLPKDTEKHTVTLDAPGGKVILDGAVKASKDPSGIAIDDEIGAKCYIFISAANFGKTTESIKDDSWGIGACKIFSVTFKKDGAVIADFVPAKRVSDGVVGLYGTVRQKFYKNAYPGKETVNFIAGPEVKADAPATGTSSDTGTSGSGSSQGGNTSPATGDTLTVVAAAAALALVLSVGATVVRKREN